MKLKYKIILFIIFFFVGVFIVSAFSFYSITKTTNEEKAAFVSLANLAGVHQNDAGKSPDIQALKEKNPDAYGWIYIPETKIDYPVMFTPDKPQKYLRKNFDYKDSIYGVPFLDAATFKNCGNNIIYGHSMDNGVMFSELQNYRDKSFYKAHRYIYFFTLEETKKYEIIAVFLAKKDGKFLYYDYTDLTEKEVFDEFVDNVRAYSLYDTGVSAVYGEELLTLSTCSYHTNDGRLAVVAKIIR